MREERSSGNGELLFPATVERRVTRGWTRLEAWPEGGLGLKGVAYGAGRAHAREAGLRVPWVEPRSKAAYSQLKVEHRPCVHQQRPAKRE